MRTYTFYDTEDYFNKLDKEMGLLQKTKDINLHEYKISDNLGEGYFKYFDMGNGIELSFVNFNLKKDFAYEFKLMKRGFELFYCIEGNILCGDYKFNNSVKINPGEIHFWKSNSCSEGWMKYPEKSNIKMVCIYFDDNFFDKLSCYGSQKIRKMIFNDELNDFTKKVNLPSLLVPFNQMARCEWNCDKISEILYLQSKAIEIISLFVNNEFFKEASQNNKIITRKEDIEKIKEAKNLIADNLINPLSIDELAEKVGLNNYKFKKGFKEVYNQTVFSYLRSLRVEKARELLIKRNDNILDIANSVGYSNSSHFAVAFRKKYGVNPSVFRKNARSL